MYAAQQAGIDAIRPGVPFKAAHDAAMSVLAHGLGDLGLLPVSVEEALSPDSRSTPAGRCTAPATCSAWTCTTAARPPPRRYVDGTLDAGMVLTVEPGLYFQADDLPVPEELRGIGIRIEDDIVVTEDGSTNLSASLPREPDEVEAWMAAAPGLSWPHPSG